MKINKEFLKIYISTVKDFFAKWFIPSLYLVCIVVATAWTYNKLLDAVNYKPYSLNTSFVTKEYVVNDVSNKKVKKMTDNLNTYAYRVDSINSIVKKLDSQYVSTIDMMIDKLNTWIGLWMGILTLLLGLVSVWQYFKINRYEERIKDLEEKNKKSLDEIEEKKTNLDGKFDYLEDKLDADLEKRTMEHRYSTLENRITSLLLCLSSIPDPQLLYSSSDRKNQLVFYMRLMSKHFAKYLVLLKKENQKNELSEDIALHLPMMLLNLRLALVRIHGISADYELHIFFFKLTNKIKMIEDQVRDKSVINEEVIGDVEKIYGEFNELIKMIGDKCE